jgi:hypothetical protein
MQDCGGTICIYKRTQIANNYEEQDKKKNYLLWGRGPKLATQAIPPTPVATIGLGPASFQK